MIFSNSYSSNNMDTNSNNSIICSNSNTMVGGEEEMDSR